MAGDDRRRDADSRLRKRAELALDRPSVTPDIAPEDVPALIHDLEVHQIELEMQNEELRLAQREIESARDAYLELYDYAPCGYLTFGERGLILEANLTFTTMVGVTRSELAHHPFSHLIVEPGRDEFYLWCKRLFAAREQQSCELRLKKTDRPWFWARLEAFVTLDDQGRTVARATVIDISQQKAAEAVVEHESRLNRVLLDAFPCVAMLIRPGTREIITANRAGLDAGAVPGEQCHRGWFGFESPCRWCLAPEVWQTGERRQRRIEIGGKVWDAHWIPVSDELYMHYAFDITDRRRLEMLVDQISQAERDSVRHDLHDTVSQDLTGITFLADALPGDVVSDPGSAVESARTIQKLAATALEQTQQIARGLDKLPDKPGALFEALSDLAVSIREVYGTPCRLTTRTRVAFPERETTTQLYLIAREAVLNAARHSGATRVTISLAEKDGIVRLTIRDNGRGFDSPTGETTGMGLEIMNARARLIGASLTISPGSAGGTVVECRWRPPEGDKDV